MSLIKVECKFIIEVEVSEHPDYDMHFDIEENHCPGTGLVGRALQEHMEQHDVTNTCWACALGGTCRIVE